MFDKAFRGSLAKYGLEDSYGYFIALAFVMSLGLAIAASFGSIGLGVVNLGADLVIYGILAAIVVFPLFAYAFVHVYSAFFKTVIATNTVLAWQTLGLVLSILLSFVVHSEALIYGGLLIFFVLLFVHPLLKVVYSERATMKDFNKTMNYVYVIILLLANLIQIILKLTNLM